MKYFLEDIPPGLIDRIVVCLPLELDTGYPSTNIKFITGYADSFRNNKYKTGLNDTSFRNYIPFIGPEPPVKYSPSSKFT